MSKQLTLSASLSVLAMLAFVLTGAPALAGEGGYAAPYLEMVAGACTRGSLGELLPMLHPGLQ